MNNKLFDGRDGGVPPANDNPTDMRGEHPDFQSAKPMSSPARVLIQRMRDGYDLIHPHGAKPALMRIQRFDLIPVHPQYVQELVSHGFIELLENTAFTRAGWLCYGLSPTGRRYAA